MDLDKLKKAALGGAKAFIKPKEQPEDSGTDLPYDDEDDIDDFTVPNEDEQISDGSDEQNDELSGTQRFNLKEIIGGIKKKKDELDQTFRSLFEAEYALDDSEREEDSDKPILVEESEEKQDISESAEIMADIKETIEGLEDSLSGGNTEIGESIEKISGKIDKIEGAISELRSSIGEEYDSGTKLFASLNGKLSGVEKRLVDTNNMLAGVSKLNDSIFDLKNSQINVRNSINDLQTAFAELKRKINAAVIILSILAAIVIILEIINLLS